MVTDKGFNKVRKRVTQSKSFYAKLLATLIFDVHFDGFVVLAFVHCPLTFEVQYLPL
jgi:hypothetical protein